MKYAVPALLLLALASAAGSKPLFKPGTALAPPDDLAPSQCQAERAQVFVGQPGAEVAEKAKAASNSDSVRLIRPGDAVTMDYREERLNLELDAAGKVVRARCG